MGFIYKPTFTSPVPGAPSHNHPGIYGCDMAGKSTMESSMIFPSTWCSCLHGLDGGFPSWLSLIKNVTWLSLYKVPWIMNRIWVTFFRGMGWKQATCTMNIWLVVYLPLWKIWVRHIPNHQPDMAAPLHWGRLFIANITVGFMVIFNSLG